MLTENEMSNWFDSLPDDKRDGMTKLSFMQECKRIMNPRANGNILAKMVEQRSREAQARQMKSRIDRATRHAAIGLR